MKFDIVVEFVVDFKDVTDRHAAETRVRKLLKGLPTDVDIDAISIQPSREERLAQFLEKEFGVPFSGRITKALRVFNEGRKA